MGGGGGFYIVDNDLVVRYGFKIKGSGLAVYNVLAMHADRGGRCYPPVSLIAVRLGYSERQVRKSIKRLEDWNIVSVVRDRGRRNTYWLVDSSKWVDIGIAPRREKPARRDEGWDWLRGKSASNAFPVLPDSVLTCEWGHDFGDGRKCVRCGYLESEEYYHQMCGLETLAFLITGGDATAEERAGVRTWQ